MFRIGDAPQVGPYLPVTALPEASEVTGDAGIGLPAGESKVEESPPTVLQNGLG